jgi:acetylornithine deacetylase/succinyl-diaminopimelate desuccinylase-like protein
MRTRFQPPLAQVSSGEASIQCAGSALSVHTPTSSLALMPTHQELRDQLAELIAIPSVSADPEHAKDVEAAAEWVAQRVRSAGGTAEVVPWNGGRPLVIGELAASERADSAPTILCYAHFDVQPPDPLDLWESPPYELSERDGWLYARGVADDKAHLFMLVESARQLAEAGQLPVNLRFAFDSEEEVGGQSVVEWVARDEHGADAAIVLDGDLYDRDIPTFYTALRGMAYFHVNVRTGERDLHSGLFGGAALNAMHALVQTLSGVLPRDGRLPDPLRAGITPPSPEELESWNLLTPGSELLASVGAPPADVRAADEFYVRTWAEPSVDVHGLAGGSPQLVKTVLPVEAWANVSIRLAPGQHVDEIAPVFERLLREAAPAGARLEIELRSKGEPALVSPDAPAITLAREAFEHVLGNDSVLVRVGGSIPVAEKIVAKGVPAIITGIATKDANAHSPNEKFPAEYLQLGVEAVSETYRRLGQLE